MLSQCCFYKTISEKQKGVHSGCRALLLGVTEPEEFRFEPCLVLKQNSDATVWTRCLAQTKDITFSLWWSLHVQQLHRPRGTAGEDWIMWDFIRDESFKAWGLHAGAGTTDPGPVCLTRVETCLGECYYEVNLGFSVKLFRAHQFISWWKSTDKCFTNAVFPTAARTTWVWTKRRMKVRHFL